VLLGMLFLVASPLLMWVMKSPFGFISNVIQVLFGFRSWVGYHPVEKVYYKLPVIRKGVLTPISAMKHQQFSDETITNLNLLYARDYRVWKDVNIIFYAFRDLGN
jgi:hypothetical protein